MLSDEDSRAVQRVHARNTASSSESDTSTLLRGHHSHSNTHIPSLPNAPSTPSKRDHYHGVNGGHLLSIPRIRSFRFFAGLFIILVLLLSTFAVLVLIDSHSSQHQPSSAYHAQQAAYTALVSLPLQQQLDLTTGPLSFTTRSACHPFLFPRPTSTLYITSWPNHGAGLGHQFGEWLYGAALAHMQGITYVHTGFLGNSARWADWLGFGAGEDSEADVRNVAVDVDVVVRFDHDHYNNSLPRKEVEQWVQEQRVVHEQRIVAAASTLNTPALQLLAESDPVTPATLLRVYRIHVPHPANRYSCHPETNLMLRQKYCAARIHRPVTEDLFAVDRSMGATIVAFHLRCGDSCYNEFRTTPFPSVIATIRLMYDTIKQAGLGETVFHLFSQPPQDNTAEAHFAPLLTSPNLTGITLHGHWYTHAHTTLHHLITADILIGAQSSFSWVASLLHHTVAVGPVDTCRWQVDGYSKQTGEFNTTSLLVELNRSRPYQPQYRTMDDCHAMKKWTHDLPPGETGYEWK